MKKTLLTFFIWIIATNFFNIAYSQSFPERPIKIIVSLAPGATNDLIARLLAQKMSELLKSPIIVENKAGANGTLAAAYVAKENPDGYTLLLGNTSTLAIHASLFTNLSYDPIKDFQAISVVAESPSVFVINASLPPKTMKEFITYAKSKSASVAYGSPGSGSPFHLSGELLNTQTGIQMLHVPYKGASPALVDLIGGQIQAMFDNIPNVLNQIKLGKLRALCVTSSSRLPQLPDIPTISESGFSDAESTSFFALVAPRGTSSSTIGILNSKANEALKDNNLKSQFLELGAIPLGMTPQQSTHYLELQANKWSKIVKQSGAKADL